MTAANGRNSGSDLRSLDTRAGDDDLELRKRSRIRGRNSQVPDQPTKSHISELLDQEIQRIMFVHAISASGEFESANSSNAHSPPIFRNYANSSAIASSQIYGPRIDEYGSVKTPGPVTKPYPNPNPPKHS